MNKPTSYNNQSITYRSARGESVECVAQPGKALVHEITNQVDRVFEVSRVTVKFTALAEGAVVDPQPSILDRLIKIGMLNLSQSEHIARVRHADATRTSGLALRQVTDSTFEWIPTAPIYLHRSEGLQFEVVPRDSFVIAFDGRPRAVDTIRVEITLEGDSLILSAPLYKPATNSGVEAPLG